MTDTPQWQLIREDFHPEKGCLVRTARLAVSGGWLYSVADHDQLDNVVQRSLCFVPEVPT